MKILIRIPNWLGDAVMATYALEILFTHFKNAHFYLVGSVASASLFTHYPNVTTYIDTSKAGGFRILNLYKLAKKIPPCEIGITLQNSFLSALFLYFNGAKLRTGFSTEMRQILLNFHIKKPKQIHEAERFAKLIFATLAFYQIKDSTFRISQIPPKLYLQSYKALNAPKLDFFKDSKVIGINAGATYGVAKRWGESYFAEVIVELLKNDFKIILFGIKNEIPLNAKILEIVQTQIDATLNTRILNLCGQTSIEELVDYIAHLDIFLTNDSGPMHIASALGIPTLALFGPTNAKETCPFNAPNAKIISLESLGNPLSCAPCMQRVCPLAKDSKEYHACMVKLAPKFVLEALQPFINGVKQCES